MTERSKKKNIHWMGRSRKTDQQGIWIVDDSKNEKIHQWMFGAPRKKEGKAGW
jgi:hypothetical protein